MGFYYFKVTGRDTLRSLAAHHGTTSSELKTLNKLHSETIFEGQVGVLYIRTYIFVYIYFKSISNITLKCNKNEWMKICKASGQCINSEFVKIIRLCLDDLIV